MNQAIRTTRLEVPVDADGLPIFAVVEAGEIKTFIRSTRLDVPVTEDENGNKIPMVAVKNANTNINLEDYYTKDETEDFVINYIQNMLVCYPDYETALEASEESPTKVILYPEP
jgi:hypothetical protein